MLPKISRHRQLEQMDVAGLELAKIGASKFDLRDPYHTALTVSWPVFLLAGFLVLTAINLLFALLYRIDPGGLTGAHGDSFRDCFFFSVETLATVGYGEMYPAHVFTHWVASMEIYFGMAFVAIMTGLLFVRFQRPRAGIVYADTAVVTERDGVPTLMIRFGNKRMTILMDTHVRLSVLLPEQSREGVVLRRARDLTLVNDSFQVFALTLTIMHPITESSPLHGHTRETLEAANARLFLSVSAHNPVMGSPVYDLRDYKPDRIRFGARYADTVKAEPSGRAKADLTRISELATG